MEACNGIDLEHADGDLECANDDLVKAPEIDGFGPAVDEGIGDADVVQLEEGADGPANGAGLNSSEFAGGTFASVPEIKASKKPGSEKKKGQPARIGPTTISRSQRTTLSKSLSFPSKVAPANGLRKSTADVKPLKPKTKSPHLNGIAEVASSGSKGELPSKQTDLASTPASISYLAMKSSSADVDAYDNASETMQDPTSEVASQRKISGSLFSFRLDERAEKRKEFFQKLEEKIQAKEEEKTNLQAKSKESQEAEIKQLRKSLTFKAKPMPTFYKEPGPPKVELKKIPTTRAISPKLGRHKPSLEAVKTSSQVGVPSTSIEQTKSEGGVSNGNGGPMASKKLNQKALSKLPSQRSTITRPGTKIFGAKPKLSSPKNEGAKANVVEENANELLDGTNVESVGIEVDAINNSLDNRGGDDGTVSLPNTEVAGPTEVQVEG